MIYIISHPGQTTTIPRCNAPRPHRRAAQASNDARLVSMAGCELYDVGHTFAVERRAGVYQANARCRLARAAEIRTGQRPSLVGQDVPVLSLPSRSGPSRKPCGPVRPGVALCLTSRGRQIEESRSTGYGRAGRTAFSRSSRWHEVTGYTCSGPPHTLRRYSYYFLYIPIAYNISHLKGACQE